MISLPRHDQLVNVLRMSNLTVARLNFSLFVSEPIWYVGSTVYVRFGMLMWRDTRDSSHVIASHVVELNPNWTLKVLYMRQEFSTSCCIARHCG